MGFNGDFWLQVLCNHLPLEVQLIGCMQEKKHRIAPDIGFQLPRNRSKFPGQSMDQHLVPQPHPFQPAYSQRLLPFATMKCGKQSVMAQIFSEQLSGHGLLESFFLRGLSSREYLSDKLSSHGYGSISIHTIFNAMNIHLPAILMWTTGVLLVLTHCHIHHHKSAESRWQFFFTLQRNLDTKPGSKLNN